MPAAPAAAAHHLISFAPAEPPKVMVFHVGLASVLELNWLLMVVKSAMSHLLYVKMRMTQATIAMMPPISQRSQRKPPVARSL